jgi:hypothetical protein
MPVCGLFAAKITKEDAKIASARLVPQPLQRPEGDSASRSREVCKSGRESSLPFWRRTEYAARIVLQILPPRWWDLQKAEIIEMLERLKFAPITRSSGGYDWK